MKTTPDSPISTLKGGAQVCKRGEICHQFIIRQQLTHITMKKIAILLCALMCLGGVAQGQSLLKSLGQRAKNAVGNSIGKKVEKQVESEVDKVIDGKKGKKGKAAKEESTEVKTATWTCEECGHEGNTGKFCAECGAKRPAAKATNEESDEAKAATWTCEECGHEGNTGKFCDECGAKKPGGAAEVKNPAPEKVSAPAKPRKQIETAYAKSDFVPGDEIFFEDNFEHEKLGEFPLRWDLLYGYAETVTIAGRKCIGFTDDGAGSVKPLMKEDDYLPDVFTLEFDLFVNDADELCDNEVGEHTFYVEFLAPNEESVGSIRFWFRSGDGGSVLYWVVRNPSGNEIQGEKEIHVGDDGSLKSLLKLGEWNHFSYSFNKRAFKGYINGTRVINIPSMKKPTRLQFSNAGKYKYNSLSNVRLAQGAVPLYDRLMTDGKIVTYAITFELGKADLKPESMVEINRVAKLMQENPGLEFEVQGHCDASGSDKVNDPLSQQRAEAIVAALVDQGIASARLTAVGKGSHSPIADNKTDEGRAKNRRVEFVKK